VDVARWTTSFDLWRLRYFTTDELTNPLVCAAAAMPDGDGVPNLLKYYLGLPGHSAASAANLPAWSLQPMGGQHCLAFTYTHDKLANDVECTAEVSSDLVNWVSGPNRTAVLQTLDLGTVEQITVRDLTPIGSAGKHYLRLRFQQH